MVEYIVVDRINEWQNCVPCLAPVPYIRMKLHVLSTAPNKSLVWFISTVDRYVHVCVCMCIGCGGCVCVCVRLCIDIWNRHWVVSSLNYEWTFAELSLLAAKRICYTLYARALHSIHTKTAWRKSVWNKNGALHFWTACKTIECQLDGISWDSIIFEFRSKIRLECQSHPRITDFSSWFKIKSIFEASQNELIDQNPKQSELWLENANDKRLRLGRHLFFAQI